MITNSRVENELKVSWNWAKHSEAFSHCFSLTLVVSLIFYSFWQICDCFCYREVYLSLTPGEVSHRPASRASAHPEMKNKQEERPGPGLFTGGLCAASAQRDLVKTHTNPSMLATGSTQACCSWHKHNHLDPSQLLHRPASQAHSFPTELQTAPFTEVHPALAAPQRGIWAPAIFGAPQRLGGYCYRGPPLSVFDHQLLICLHQHLLQAGPATSPQPLPSVQPGRAL